MKYSCNDIAIIIPTKDRPQKICNLLESIALQKTIPRRIIIVASGQNIEDKVSSFSNKLPIEYYHTDLYGQLIQRNIAIDKLDQSTSLACFFDDDIVLEEGSLEHMISFWNKTDNHTAGVSFNVINNPEHKCSLIQRILYFSVPEQGKVLKSGMTTPTSPTNKDIRTQWLCGGATVWKQDIIKMFEHKQIKAKWAIAEDLIYSYPIGKKYPLYVSSKSCVRHEHVFDYAVSEKEYFHGKVQTLWWFYFVESNDDLSRTLFIFVTITKIIGRLFLGIIRLDNNRVKFSAGQLQGLVLFLNTLVRSQDLKSLLIDQN